MVITLSNSSAYLTSFFNQGTNWSQIINLLKLRLDHLTIIQVQF